MRYIEYHATYANGDTDTTKVYARDINSGYAKALKVFLQPLASGHRRELLTLAFWKVVL